MPPGLCQHGKLVEDTDNMCEELGGTHREYVE